MLKRDFIIIPVLMLALLLYSTCSDNNEPGSGEGRLIVKVTESANSNSGITAFLFLNDSLYGKTDSSGTYINNSVLSGNYTFICSAVNFRDTTLQIKIVGGKGNQFYFQLAPDTTWGKVLGEFEDMILFRQQTAKKPEIGTWNDQKAYDATTGATMCYKIMLIDVPERQVILNDSLKTIADGFGQYYFKIQSGTYKITGACEGYVSSSKVITVLPDSKNYVNFYMERK